MKSFNEERIKFLYMNLNNEVVIVSDIKQEKFFEKLTSHNRKDIIFNNRKEIQHVDSLLRGHTYVWRLDQSYRTYAAYVYTCKFICSLKNNKTKQTFLKKLINVLLHDSCIDACSKKRLLEYLFYYLHATFPKSQVDITRFIKDIFGG